MNNKEIKKPIPEELNPEELSMVTGGDSVLRSPSLPADADRFAPPAANTVTDGSTSVGVCAKCRQGMSKDKLYRYNGKEYCRVCLMSFF